MIKEGSAITEVVNDVFTNLPFEPSPDDNGSRMKIQVPCGTTWYIPNGIDVQIKKMVNGVLTHIADQAFNVVTQVFNTNTWAQTGSLWFSSIDSTDYLHQAWRGQTGELRPITSGVSWSQTWSDADMAGGGISTDTGSTFTVPLDGGEWYISAAISRLASGGAEVLIYGTVASMLTQMINIIEIEPTH